MCVRVGLLSQEKAYLRCTVMMDSRDQRPVQARLPPRSPHEAAWQSYQPDQHGDQDARTGATGTFHHLFYTLKDTVLQELDL